MKIVLKEAFLRSCDALEPANQAALFRVLLGLQRALADPKVHRGLGLRKLHPSGVWEARVGLSLRALFVLSRNEAVFLFLGAHDEVKRFLRTL